MKSTNQAEVFYGHILDLLLKKKAEFMVGGTYAFCSYTGIVRPTKDMDIFTPVTTYPKILKICSEAGYLTELLDPTWIAKVKEGDFFVDIIFAERNGLHQVATNWLHYARDGDVLGRKVKLAPVEQMIRSKAYLQFKDKYDGADVIHLILLYGKSLDWKWLLSSMNPHWLLLFGHLVNFCFIYPSERNTIPKWLIDEMVTRFKNEFLLPPMNEKITRGLLISAEYHVSIEKWGFTPVRK